MQYRSWEEEAGSFLRYVAQIELLEFVDPSGPVYDLKRGASVFMEAQKEDPLTSGFILWWRAHLPFMLETRIQKVQKQKDTLKSTLSMALDSLSTDPIQLVNWMKDCKEVVATELSLIQKMMDQRTPARFTYSGFPVSNPDEIPDPTLRGCLNGIDAAMKLFEKRGVSKVLSSTVKKWRIRFQRPGETALGYYYPGDYMVELVVNPDPSKLVSRDWTWVIIHEVGHHLHMNMIPPDAKRFWDSAWDRVGEIQKEVRDAEVIKVTQEERILLWKKLLKARGDLRSLKLTSEQRAKLHLILLHPLMNDPYSTPKQLRWTKRGLRVLPFLQIFPEGVDPMTWIPPAIEDPKTGERFSSNTFRIFKENFCLDMTWNHPEVSVIDAKAEIESKVKPYIESLGIPRPYGHRNNLEDFAVTFESFIISPHTLSETAKYRMLRTLSLSGLYGKALVKVARGVASRILSRYHKA